MTIYELRQAGKISSRVYNAIMKNAAIEIDYMFGYKRWKDTMVSSDEIGNLTVNELFELIGEERISHWRNLGQKSLDELNGLI